MKRILPILILLGIAAGALAVNPYLMVLARKNVSAACDGSGVWGTDTETMEYMADDFCTTNFAVVDAGAALDTYNEAAAFSGTHGLRVTQSGSEVLAFAEGIIPEDDDFSIGFYFGISSGDLTANAYLYLCEISPNASPNGSNILRFRWGNFSPQNFRIQGATNSAQINGVDPTATNYWVSIDYNRNGTSTMTVYEQGNASALGSETCTTADVGIDYIRFGVVESNDGTPTYTLDMDSFIYDADGGTVLEP